MSAPGGVLLGGCLFWGGGFSWGRGCLLPGGGVSGLGGGCSRGCVCVCSGGGVVWSRVGVCSWGGVSSPRGVSAPGGVCSWEGVCIPACTEADTHPPLTESQTPVKTLPWPNFVAAGKKGLKQKGRAASLLDPKFKNWIPIFVSAATVQCYSNTSPWQKRVHSVADPGFPRQGGTNPKWGCQTIIWP